MKISLRITLLMVAMSVISVGVVGTVLAHRAWNAAETMAKDLTRSMARQVAADLRNYLEINWYRVTSLVTVMEGFESITPMARRAFINELLKSTVEKNYAVLAAWTIWEPNTLEGNDEAWIDTPGSDGIGRFVPVHSRTAAGGTVLELIEDFEDDDFYTMPMRQGRQIIMDPYPDFLAGMDVNVITIVAPSATRGARFWGSSAST